MTSDGIKNLALEMGCGMQRLIRSAKVRSYEVVAHCVTELCVLAARILRTSLRRFLPGLLSQKVWWEPDVNVQGRPLKHGTAFFK